MTITSSHGGRRESTVEFEPAAAGDRLPPQQRSVADITEQLMGEFGAQINLSVISRTVLSCHEDLQRAAGASPQLLERLARGRLLLQVARTTTAPCPA